MALTRSRRTKASTIYGATGDDGVAIGRVKKIKLADKIAALTHLARHMGVLNDKLKVQGDAENPLTLLVKQFQGAAIKPGANFPAG